MTASRHRPAGLATERTALAWRRSLAGLLGVALLAGRSALTHWPVLAGAIATSLVGAAVIGACVLGQRRLLALRRPAPGPLRPVTITTLSGGALVTALLGAALLAR